MKRARTRAVVVSDADPTTAAIASGPARKRYAAPACRDLGVVHRVTRKTGGDTDNSKQHPTRR